MSPPSRRPKSGSDPANEQSDDSTATEALDDPSVEQPTATEALADPSVEQPTAEPRRDSGFLSNVEFLTGPDPNLGSFLLVVGMVSIVFVALFQLTIPEPVSYLLTAGVLFVTVLSALFAFLLDAFGYFDAPTEPTKPVPSRSRTARPWVPTKPAKPLPPLLNFDAELRAYADMYDGDLPDAFDPFLEDYRRLKTNTENRPSIASDLRADLNPIGTLFERGSEGDRLYEKISTGLFEYIGSERGHVTIEDVTFGDQDDTPVSIEELAGQIGTVDLLVSNRGEAVAAVVEVEFRDERNAVVASRRIDLGVLSPGVRKSMAVEAFVPAETVRATTTLETFLDEERGEERANRLTSSR
jgi:hypothetical protein